MLSDEILSAPADAVVIPMSETVMDAAVSAATVLRSSGVKTQVYFENRKWKQKIGYADKSGIPYAIILGEDEAAKGVVGVKDMSTGEQVSLTPAEAADYINKALESRRSGRVILG